MEEDGFTVVIRDDEGNAAVQARSQVPVQLQSCHTAIVDGYLIEGHVPAADVRRLLQERPAVLGLAVPGMPAGSPGMEIPGLSPEPYEVLAFDGSGTTVVFARYSG